MESSVVFKGSVNGLTIIFDEKEEFGEIISNIEKKLIDNSRFFKGASLAVKYRGKKLSKDQEDKIFNLLCQQSGADIKSFNHEEKTIQEKSKITRPSTDKMKMKTMFFKGTEEGPTKFYRGTVRSGQLLKFNGNLVVVGDVNPGGELVATGNVVVMGSLRGMVHAGADGNKQAYVAALNLQPMQLRIAQVITRSPDDKPIKHEFVPELAFVKDDMVYIDRYLPQHK